MKKLPWYLSHQLSLTQSNAVRIERDRQVVKTDTMLVLQCLVPFSLAWLARADPTLTPSTMITTITAPTVSSSTIEPTTTTKTTTQSPTTSSSTTSPTLLPSNSSNRPEASLSTSPNLPKAPSPVFSIHWAIAAFMSVSFTLAAMTWRKRAGDLLCCHENIVPDEIIVRRYDDVPAAHIELMPVSTFESTRPRCSFEGDSVSSSLEGAYMQMLDDSSSSN